MAQVYLDLLNRAADPGGLGTFTNALNQGTTRNQVVLAIGGSTENRTGLVESFYSQFLHRAAEPTGLMRAVQFLGTGGDALGRAIGPNGEAEFTRALAAGVSRVQVAAAIFSSTAYQQKLVASYYQRFLRRPADPQGAARLG